MNQNAAQDSVPAHPSEELPTQYVTFHVGNLFFGVAVGEVQEVIRLQPMTPVPLASPIVRGLVNLRGQIITAIDMRLLLKLPDTGSEKPLMNVVVKAGSETVSLLVDSIGDVIEVDRDAYEPNPKTLPSHIAKVLGGVFKLNQQLLLVINAANCVELIS